MARVRLLLDEDTPLLLAQTLRSRGHDAVHALEAGLRSRPDPQVFDAAITDGRALLTHNVRHFMPLVAQITQAGRAHRGLLLAEQVEFRDILARTLRFLADRSDEDLTNAIVWL